MSVAVERRTVAHDSSRTITFALSRSHLARRWHLLRMDVLGQRSRSLVLDSSRGRVGTRLLFASGEKDLKVGATIKIDYEEISPSKLKKLRKDLTYLNGNSDVVTNYRDIRTRGYIKIPRGAWYLVDSLEASDGRSCPPMPELEFKVKLDNTGKDERFRGQEAAVAAMFEHEQGQIIRPPGTGKTQIALAFAARCKTRTLVLVHTKDILDQWRRYVEKAIPSAEIGVIGSGKNSVGHITIATIQSVRKYTDPNPSNRKFWRQFGCLIADESHHGAAKTWEHVINSCPGRYRFGFTASPTRADGLHPSLKFLFGPVIHRQKFSSPVDLTVIPVQTNFKFRWGGPWDWSRLVNALITDDGRNQQIAEVADAEYEAGNSVLILSRRIEHLERISERLSCANTILTGARKDADRKGILAAFTAGEIRCVLATQLADESLDVQRLNRVLLTHPGKHEGRLVQQIGRTLRESSGKDDAKVYDFVDKQVGVLRKQWDDRRRAYKQNRIKIQSSGRLSWR